MGNEKILVRLSDGTAVDVVDCSFDLLLHLLHKSNFDVKKVEKEIEWLCEFNREPNLLRGLLEKSLRQLSSELANKVLVKSLSAGLERSKIVEDMLIDLNKIQYSIAENALDMRKVLKLRRKVFVGEEGYPSTAATNGYEKESIHIMASIRGELVACVSVAFDGVQGVPMDKHLDLSQYKRGVKIVEVDKLAVIGEKRKKELSFHIMWIAYSVARFWGAQRMFIFTLSHKNDNLNIYSRFGFKEFGSFNIFHGKKATALMLDFDDLDTYEKKLDTADLLKLGRKLLNRFSLRNSK